MSQEEGKERKKSWLGAGAEWEKKTSGKMATAQKSKWKSP